MADRGCSADGAPAASAKSWSHIHHSDQGSQYTDQTYQALLKNHDIQISMNGVGSWYDNAPMESFIGTLKKRVGASSPVPHPERNEVGLVLLPRSILHRRRRHSSLDYLSPEAEEQLYHQQQV